MYPCCPIRAWRPEDDLPTLVEVSRAADTLFAEHGLDLPPDDPAHELARARWVLVAGTPPVGFAAVDTVRPRTSRSSVCTRRTAGEGSAALCSRPRARSPRVRDSGRSR